MNPVAVIAPPLCPVCALLGREVRDARIAEHLSAHSKAELVEALAAPLRPRPIEREPEFDDIVGAPMVVAAGMEVTKRSERDVVVAFPSKPSAPAKNERRHRGPAPSERRRGPLTHVQRTELHEQLKRGVSRVILADALGISKGSLFQHEIGNCACASRGLTS